LHDRAENAACFKSPSKEKMPGCEKEKRWRKETRRKVERGSRTLVNLKQNLDSVSPAYGFYTCRHGRA